jgi:predicted ATPase
MNRKVDNRSDFYSLGVTFYQILLGCLPFEAQDEPGFIHCHLAKQPIPPHKVNPTIPIIISDILMKLLAKAAEDRYQSASGLISDLTKCLNQLRENGVIEPFVLGADDVTDKFQIPQKLYGREEQLDLLFSAFERVSKGHKELMLVTGYTGVGKSSLIYEIHGPIAQRNGYFISGKFDQFQHDIPYSGLIQAFKELVRQILTQSKDEIDAWKQKLLNMLGPNARVICDIIPEIGLIIGEQPPEMELPPEETKNRFNMIVQKFIRVFCTPEHPLVLFLDDLQWADLSSLKLLEVLLSDSELNNMLLIGAYRDNEVSEKHPLLLTFQNIKNENVFTSTIVLKPLGLPHFQQLLTETFKLNLDNVYELAELAIIKTGGNPFFLNQFLASLYREKLIKFNFTSHRWQWDIEEIRHAGITDNVVELITARIHKLAPDLQEILNLAACIGNKIDLKTLSIISQKPYRETYGILQEALREGILIANGSLFINNESNLEDLNFVFLHDRIQQAAYSLITEEDRPKVHLKIGRLMLSNSNRGQNEERLLDIVNQFNLGFPLIDDVTEKESIAKLELLAGRRSKKATAYEAAYLYLKAGINLIADYGWTHLYDLTMALFL